MSEDKLDKTMLTRRSFVKRASAAAALPAVGYGSEPLMRSLAVDFKSREPESDGETVCTTICRSNCFQGCMLNVHVRDGIVRKMSPAPYPDDIYTGCCLRGLTIPERTYSPNRIRYPMKRAGERGENKWERISWDEAIDEIAEKFNAIREEYGPGALAIDLGSGVYGQVQGARGLLTRFGNALEATMVDICYDQSFGHGTNRVIGGGAWTYGSEITNVFQSKHVLIWGANPVYATPQSWRILRAAQEQGVKLTCIDPMYSATATRCDEYIYIKPGSDLIVALAMLNEVISKDLIDLEFTKEKTSACYLIKEKDGLLLRRSDFDEAFAAEYAAEQKAVAARTATQTLFDEPYVVNEETELHELSSMCKTPSMEGNFTVEGVKVTTVYSALKEHASQYSIAEASKLSGVSEEDIQKLVKIYTEEGPVFLFSIYGIDHYQNGHLWAQTMALLSGLTGNLAKPGTSLGGAYIFSAELPFNYLGFLYGSKSMAYGSIPQNHFPEVMDTQMHKGEAYPIKGLITYASNSMSNYPDQNEWIEKVTKNIEFHVVIDVSFTDTARHADMLLPSSFWLEYEDFRVNFSNPYMVIGEKAIDPLFESKPDAEILALMAEKLGVGDIVPHKSEAEWAQIYFENETMKKLGWSFDKLKQEKAIRCQGSSEKPFVRGEDGFPTPTGRIDLYCENPLPRVDYGQDWQEEAARSHFPYFKPPNEAWEDNELHDKYPLCFIQEHARYRTHTQWFNVDTLNELDPEPILSLSREDAEARGIENGDICEVFNDRGSCVLKAKINDGLSAGLCSTPKGWQRHQFIEGCFQELTNISVDPMAVNFTYYDTLVDVRKRG